MANKWGDYLRKCEKTKQENHIEENTMRLYTVTWEIEINATSPREACQLALEVQRDVNSLATVFGVQGFYEDSTPMDYVQETIDLSIPENEAL